ncbi:MAG: tetratricopeptide repeat protein, partial [Planctomycetota bacterium]
QEIAQGRYAEARRMAEHYLARHPKEAQAMLMVGLTYSKADNHGAAQPWFERALAQDPNYYIGHEYLADSLFKQGALDAARREYEAFGAFVPTEPKVQYQLGLIDLELSALDAAEARFQRAISLLEALRARDPKMYNARLPDLASYHARLGDVAFARDDYTAARDAFLTATKLCPGNVSAFYTLSLAQRRLGEDALADEALARYEQGRATVVGGPRGGTGR